MSACGCRCEALHLCKIQAHQLDGSEICHSPLHSRLENIIAIINAVRGLLSDESQHTAQQREILYSLGDFQCVCMRRFGQVVLGPPGSGKSTYCKGVCEFLNAIGR